MACRQVEYAIRRHRCEPYDRKRIGGGVRYTVNTLAGPKALQWDT